MKPSHRALNYGFAKFLTWSIATLVVAAGCCARDRPTAAVNVLFLGDTYFGESYAARNGRPAVDGHHMVMSFADLLEQADVTVVNLEAPITDIEISPFAGGKRYLHKADPATTPSVLQRHGIDIVSLANNHALDYGLTGLADTRRWLSAVDIEACGAGDDVNQSARPVVHHLSLGTSERALAVLCAFDERPNYATKFSWYASAQRAGVQRLAVGDRLETETAASLARLETETKPLAIAFPHWGKNYQGVTDRQRRQARSLIDGGIDLVIGHGAHMAQAVERYRGRWIVYGLGNFAFGSPGRYQRFGAAPYSLIANLQLATPGGTDQLRLYPIVSDNRRTNYRPRFVDRQQFAEAIDILLADGHSAAQSGHDRFGFHLALPLDLD